jgi:hypothetical protein
MPYFVVDRVTNVETPYAATDGGAMEDRREQLHHDIENIALIFHDHDADGDACR